MRNQRKIFGYERRLGFHWFCHVSALTQAALSIFLLQNLSRFAGIAVIRKPLNEIQTGNLIFVLFMLL